MLRSTSSLLLATLVVCLGTACDGAGEPELERAAPPPVPPGLSALVPIDAFAFVELESINALNLCSRDLIGVFDTDTAESYDVAESLARLLGQEQPFDFIDPTRPVGLAWSLPPGEMIPLVTVIAAIGPGQHDMAEIVQAAGAASSTFVNGWAALSMHPDYAPCGGDTALTRDLPGGQARARIRLRTVVDTYRDFIEAGLDQVEMAAEAAAEDPELVAAGFDLVAFMELYFEAIRLMLDGVDTLDVAAEIAGTEIGVEAWLDVQAESPLAIATAGEPTNLVEIARTVDPGAAFVGFIAFDWQRGMSWLEPAIESVIAFYPEEFGKLMEAQLAHYAELYPLLGDSLAASGGFGPGGMRFSYAFDSNDAEAYIDGYVELMETTLPEIEGLVFDGPHERTIDGVDVVEYTTIFGEEFYGLMLGQNADELTEEEIEALRPSMEAMYGPDGLVMRLASADSRLAMVLGGDDAWFSEAYERMRSPDADLPPALERALARVGDANPAVVLHVDLARMFSQLWETIRELPGAERPPSLAEFDRVSVPLTFWAAVDGPEWRGGTVFDVARISDLIDATKKIEESRAGDVTIEGERVEPAPEDVPAEPVLEDPDDG